MNGYLTVTPSPLPIADFSASPSEGPVPLTVSFTDESSGSGITEWKWNFGDGNSTTVTNPAEKNQVHQYSGTPLNGYDVSLTVTNINGNDTKSRYKYILPRQGPVARINGSPTTGDAPHLVQFTDESEGIGLKKWDWTFGDGESSSDQNPIHVYRNTGNYQVSLTVTDAFNQEADSSNLPVSILSPPPVPPPPPPIDPELWLGFVDFNATPVNGSYPLTVEINDTSGGPDIISYQWVLSDDNRTVLTDRNITHVFENPGTYNVNHSVITSVGTFWNNKTSYILVEPTPALFLSINNISPTTGPNNANLPAVIRGTNFQPGVLVNLTNSGISIPGTVTSRNNVSISCTFPLTGAPIRTYNLNVRNPDGTMKTKQNAFSVTNASPTIISISPVSGFNTSVLSVTITGTAFRNGVTASLVNNTTTLDATIINRTITQIICSLPLGSARPGIYNLTIQNIDGTSVTRNNAFTVLSPGNDPTVTSITPSSGTNTATLPVTIIGTNYRTGATVTITNGSTVKSVPGMVTGGTKISCSLPLTSLPIGLYNLTIRNTDGSYIVHPDAFQVKNPTPVITTYNPSSGFNTSTMQIVLTGSGYASGCQVTLTNQSITIPGAISSFSTTKLLGTFILTGTPAGIYTLKVTNPGGQNATKPFTVSAPGNSPVITNFTPSSGVNTAALPFIINGLNFRSGATVIITNNTTNRSVTGTGTTTKITCSLPLTGLPIGLYNLTVRNGDGSNITSSDYFMVKNPTPKISTYIPTSGFNTSTISITLTGSGYASGCQLTLTNQSTTIPGIISSFSTTKLVGMFSLNGTPAGIYNLTVTNPGGPNTTKPFTIFSPGTDPTITGFTPTSGANTAALSITITGTNFRPNPSVIITNNSTSRTVTGTVTGNITIKCSLPLTGLPFGLYNLTVRNTDGSSVTRENEFTVNNPAPAISSLTPTSGYTSGPATVTISGSKFVSGVLISLENSTSSLPGTVTSFLATKITGTFALHTLSTGTYNLTVTNPGGSNTTKPFTVFSPGSDPTITGFTPTFGVNTAALPITITGTNYRKGTTVTITNNTTSRTVTGTVTGNITIKCSLPLIGLPFGLYNLTVRNTDGSSVTRENEFTVNNPAPTISSVTPSTGYTPGSVTVTVSGSKFVSGAGILLVNATSYLPGAVTSFSTTKITGAFVLGSLSPGTYNLTVNNPGDANGTKVNAFTVLNPGTAPVISTINPASGFNNANLPVTITGVNFRSPAVFLNQGSLVKQALATAGKTSSASTLYITLPLAGVPGGLYNITVRNSDGVNGTAYEIFYVTDQAWISKAAQTGGRSPVVQFQRNPTGIQPHLPPCIGPSNRQVVRR